MINIRFCIILFLLITNTLNSQSVPQGISYQAVAIKKKDIKLAGENITQIYWSNKEIDVRFSIYDSYPGTLSYSESHQVQTDDFGVFSLIIGKGVVKSGDFKLINWELGDAHLQVEIDFEGNGNYELIGVQKFWSVPYAFVPKSQLFNNFKNDSLLNDLDKKFTYLRNRDQDTIVGNENGVSLEYLDSLNRVLLDSIGKLNLFFSKDQDTIIGNEWQNLSKSADSIFISNGKGIKLLDDDTLNEIQELSFKNDSLFLTKSNRRISIQDILKNVNNKSGFVSTGDSSYNVLLTNGVKIKRICEETLPNNFGLGIATVREFIEFGDSVYYLGHYYSTSGTKGEFVVSKSKLNCGTKLIFKTVNTEYFTGAAVPLGQNSNEINFLVPRYAQSEYYVNTYNISNFSISSVKLNPPNNATQWTSNNIPYILAQYSFRDTMYLIYNNLITKSSGSYVGPNRLYKFNLKTGNVFFIDSINDYSSFGSGSNSSGTLQFYDSLMFHSNPITQEIYTTNLMTLKKELIFTNLENLSNVGALNLYANFFFRFFPHSNTIFIPEVNNAQVPAIIFDIKSKKSVIDNNWYKQKDASLILAGFSIVKNLNSDKKFYIDYFGDWNRPFFYYLDPVFSFYK